MLKKLLFLLGLAALTSSSLKADIYEFDLAHTQVGFTVTHLTLAKVHGRFTEYSGNLDINEKDVTKSMLEFAAEIKGIQTGNAKRDSHLQSPDFFDAALHPQITFKSSKISKAGKVAYLVEGVLAMRGVTKTVKLKATLSDAFTTDWGATKRAFSLKGEINRFDFGVAWNKTSKTGSLMVGEIVYLNIDGEIDVKKK